MRIKALLAITVAMAGMSAWAQTAPASVPALTPGGMATPADKPTSVSSMSKLPIKKFLSADEATIAAVKRWQQTGRAKPIVSDNGEVLFPYGQYLPTVVCAPERVCAIALKEGENVVGPPSTGNNTQWKTYPGASGAGAKRRTHIMVTPTDVNIETNLIVHTDQRTYQIHLVSRADGEYLGQVGFYYPNDMADAWAAQAKDQNNEKVAQASNNIAELNVDMENVDRAYKISGGDASTRPQLVFNDGRRTLIQLPKIVAVTEMPVFVVIGKDGKKQLANFKPVATKSGTTWLIVERLFQHGALLTGADGEEGRIDIEWTKSPVASSGDKSSTWWGANN